MNPALEQFLGTARWFGAKGRDFEVTSVEAIIVSAGPPLLRIELATVTFADGQTATYQLPLVYYSKPQEHLDHALVGAWVDEELGEVFVYDALHDHEATPMLLKGFADERGADGLRFHRVGDVELDTEARSAVLTAEQSNSSVAFGEDSLLKVFRKVTAGPNPDIDLHVALTEAGSDHVAALYGWLELSTAGGEVMHLALLQQFLRTASDGWELAMTSVRDLLADPDVSAADAGGDFAAEAHRLGAAVAEIHLMLASAFPSRTADAAALAGAMKARLDAASAIVPALSEHAPALRERFDALTRIDEPIAAQRIHGDLHLGQTLRTVKGWKIVDFEGEPAKPLAERVQPDSVWRDVAGMLRSFDYASNVINEAPGEGGGHTASRAASWADRNRAAFLDGYREVTGHDGREGDTPASVLVAAYEADKAVYEVVYETRNRPDWVWIPMEAIARLTKES